MKYEIVLQIHDGWVDVNASRTNSVTSYSTMVQPPGSLNDICELSRHQTNLDNAVLDPVTNPSI